MSESPGEQGCPAASWSPLSCSARQVPELVVCPHLLCAWWLPVAMVPSAVATTALPRRFGSQSTRISLGDLQGAPPGRGTEVQ